MNTEIFNAHDHLVSIKTRDGVKPYYPAAWRLYELSVRFPNANFKSEIVHMNLEHDFVIVKAYLFLGTDYASSEKRAEAFKQGKLSMLDKVETAAKARAARDFGISTELALDMEDATVDETEPVQQQPQQQQQHRQPATPAPAAKPAPKQDNPTASRLERLFQRGEATNMWAKRGDFLAYMSKVLAQPITRDNVGELDSSMLDVIEDAMLEPEQRGAA